MKVEVTADDVKLDSSSEYSMGTSELEKKANEIYPDEFWGHASISDLLIKLMDEVVELREKTKNY